MARTKTSKFNTWILAAAALLAPAVMAARTQAQSSQSQPAQIEQTQDQADEAAAPDGVCPFYCNSSAQCTTGCKTEALCQEHRCWPL